MKDIVLAFGSVPKDGGTFTFYRNMRTPLLEHGIDLRCVTVGQQEAGLWEEDFVDDCCVLLAATESNVKKQAQFFSRWCEDEGVDIVMGVNSVAILSALPHLPANIRFMSRCANAFDHGYRITVSCYERLSRLIALAPRQIEDLVNDYGAQRDRIELIPNGTSIERFQSAAECTRGTSEAIRLGFLGRLEHSQKGVLHLPGILSRLKENEVNFTLAVAGKGVHEAKLKQELDSYIQAGKVRFIGALAPSEIPAYFAEIDVYLFPSHFEGSPNALIEAIMSGCVPAAWQVGGIIDFLVEDETNGMLAEVGDCHSLADKITVLANDRERLNTMSQNASLTARERFSLPRVINDYVRVVREVMSEPVMAYKVKSWADFQIEPAFHQPFWRQLIPPAAKKFIKKSLFKLNLVNRYE